MVVLALAALAALRVFLFSAAFPLFANVDEHMHVDIALKYARGYLPQPGSEGYEPEMGTWVGIYHSPEYLHRRDAEDPLPPPPWRRPRGAMVGAIQGREALLDRRSNVDAFEPPFYYATAGAWLRLGRAMGLEGGYLLYWVRALNIVTAFVLVLSAYWFLRDVYPGDRLMRLGVPLLLAVFPQDTLYYVTSDALSPLLGSVAFFLALRTARRPEAGAEIYAAAGLVTAAAFLTKYTNVFLIAVCALASWHAARSRLGLLPGRGQGGKLALLWLLILMPCALWLIRNQLVLGDFTGTARKLEMMTWERKSLAEYWPHPIFTPAGFLYFAKELTATFWRGELAWYHTTLSWKAADLVYVGSSLLFVTLAMVGLRRRAQRRLAALAEGLGLAAVLTAGAVLAVLSLMFVFPEVHNPSAARPFFVQGRLVCGATLPFLLLYVRGIEVATSRLPRGREAAAWACVAAVAALAAISEIALTWNVFASPYNWFHLP